MNLPENIIVIIIVAIVVGIAREITSFVLRGIITIIGIVIVLACIYFYFTENNEPMLIADAINTFAHFKNYAIVALIS